MTDEATPIAQMYAEIERLASVLDDLRADAGAMRSEDYAGQPDELEPLRVGLAQIVARAEAAEKDAARYRAALVWALGAGDEFALRPEGRGQFWWRSELAERAGLFWNGECYLDRP